MLIRKYKKSDITSIEKLGIELHNNYKFSLDDFSSCIVAEDKFNIIGFITYSIIYERAEIIDIIIDNEYRKKGYGTLLLEKTFNIIKDNNCDSITLEVNSNNKNAINLYKNNGFEIVSVRKNHYDNSDAYLMKKELR